MEAAVSEVLARLDITVVAEDGDSCRKLIRRLCDMMDEDLAGAPSYTISTIEGNAACDVMILRGKGGGGE